VSHLTRLVALEDIPLPCTHAEILEAMSSHATVLIVDDDSDFGELLAESLRFEGWTALLAAGFDEALRVARSAAIDVVLADVLLAGGSGTALEDAFRAESRLADIPFVFMTGGTLNLDRGGRERTLLKPFEITDACALLASAARQPSPP
jgi:DNA-binding response OmpR family regulator